MVCKKFKCVFVEVQKDEKLNIAQMSDVLGKYFIVAEV